MTAADGSEIGTVEELVGDTGKDIVNGLSITTGLLARPKYVPAERVSEIVDGEVRLDLAAEAVERLDDHEQQPPSAELRP